MDTCVACGAELGVGRFCLNCGHRIGAPAPDRDLAAPPPPVATATAPAPAPAPTPADERPAAPGPEPERRSAPAPVADEAGTTGLVTTTAPVAEGPVAPISPPVQAADPALVPPTGPAAAEPAAQATTPPDSDVAAPRRTTWDPREDLLPYEEVDDPDGDLPVRGNAWIGWVLGAALLLGLAFVLLRTFDSGDDVATDVATDDTTSASQSVDPGAEPSEGETDASAGVGKARELARGATFEVPATAPPTTDFDGNLVAYEASQMGDGNPATAWRMAGDASGQTITVTLAEPGVVTRVGLVNGYAKKVAGVDWYPNNRRVLAVTWGFDDGSSVEQTFAERPGMQRLKVPPVETETVTLTVDAVTPPGLGNLGRDYTAISEVSVTGRRAG